MDIPAAAAGVGSRLTAAFVRGSLTQLLTVLLTFYVLFYLLRDRRAALQLIGDLAPLSPQGGRERGVN